ncbi:MAG TPA: thiamine pyrophosphate-dependent enzyme, partial [Actinomycetota bacterium]|nr:thiamine pyrophosphate-dependent enzyme [Actinomycetota bacterium]
LVSTALGVAASGGRNGPAEWGERQPVVALIGDLSFLHDFGAVAWNAQRGIDLTIVVVSNGGGEIFSLLPQRSLPEHRDLFVTPHGADIGALSRAAGASHTLVERASELEQALASEMAGRGLRVVEVTVNPERSLALRAALRESIASALV